MKMRKILPLVILAVGALFLLSGCDQLLDAIFQNNQIYVDVRVSGSGPFASDYDKTSTFGYNSGRVIVYLQDSRGHITSASTYWTSLDNFSVHYGINFTGLKDDTFLVYADYTSYYTPLNVGSITTSAVQLVTPHDATGHSADVTIDF